MTVTTAIIPVLDGIPHPLGRHVEHDERSRAFAFDVPAAVAPQTTVSWPHNGPVLNQGQLGSCTGNAFVQTMETGPLYSVGAVPDVEAEAVKVYGLATKLFDAIPGSYPPDDTGSSGLAVCKAGKRLHLCKGYRHVFGLAHAKATIRMTPMMTGTVWYEGMFHPDADGTVHGTGQIAGGHEYEILGYDPDEDDWLALNSWGQWGIGIPGIAPTGLFTIPGKLYADLLAQQGDISIPHR